MNILVNILVLMNIFSAIILYPRKQKVELLHICNHATVIRLSYLRLYRAVGRLGEKFDFLAPWDVKLIATLITKPTNLSHIQSELQNDT